MNRTIWFFARNGFCKKCSENSFFKTSSICFRFPSIHVRIQYGIYPSIFVGSYTNVNCIVSSACNLSNDRVTVFVDRLVFFASSSIFCRGSFINSLIICKSVFVKLGLVPALSASNIVKTRTFFIRFFASSNFCCTFSFMTILQTVIPPTHGTTKNGSPINFTCCKTSSISSPVITK